MVSTPRVVAEAGNSRLVQSERSDRAYDLILESQVVDSMGVPGWSQQDHWYIPLVSRSVSGDTNPRHAMRLLLDALQIATVQAGERLGD